MLDDLLAGVLDYIFDHALACILIFAGMLIASGVMAYYGIL